MIDTHVHARRELLSAVDPRQLHGRLQRPCQAAVPEQTLAGGLLGEGAKGAGASDVQGCGGRVEGGLGRGAGARRTRTRVKRRREERERKKTRLKKKKKKKLFFRSFSLSLSHSRNLNFLFLPVSSESCIKTRLDRLVSLFLFLSLARSTKKKKLSLFFSCFSLPQNSNHYNQRTKAKKKIVDLFFSQARARKAKS